MDLKAPKPVAELVLPSATRDRTPPYEEWQSFSGGVAEGHFLTDDLAEVRQRLYAEGHAAKVSLSHKGEPRKLTYALPKGKMVIHKAARRRRGHRGLPAPLLPALPRQRPARGGRPGDGSLA